MEPTQNQPQSTAPVTSPAQPVATPMQPMPMASASGSSKKLIGIIITVIVLLALAGGAFAYFTGVFVSLPELASKALDKSRSATSGSYDTTVSVDLSGLKDGADNVVGNFLPMGLDTKKISLTLKGAYDISDSENKKMSSVMDLDLGVATAGAEVRMLDGKLYAMLSKVPTIAMLGGLSEYQNKWFSLDTKAKGGVTDMLPLGKLTAVDEGVLKDLTADQKEHVYAMTRDAHFIKVVKKLAPETVGGVSSYHFTFDLDKEGIVDYTQKLKEYVNDAGKDSSELSSFDPTFDAADFDQLKDFTGELWIGRSDGLLHKVSVSFGIQPDKEKDDQVKVNVISIFSDWNKPVEITAPEKSTSFEDLIMGMMGGAMEQAQGKAEDARAKSEMSSLRAQAELYFSDKGNDSYSGLCTSKEVKALGTGLEGEGAHNFYCSAKSQAYAAAVVLPGGNKFCVDSNGMAGIVTSMPKGTTCPEVAAPVDDLQF